jgi:pSer/pThr/pTyr-binding forkhead associated (FHA) protein
VPAELPIEPVPEPTPEPAPEPVVETPPAAKQWTVTVTVDPSLRDPDGPEAPTDVADVVLAIDKPVCLIGRKSEKRGIHPEVALEMDDGVSHRHALLTQGDDGSLTLRDIGSSNGTRLNGEDVKALEDVPLHDGDQVTLGRWTRLTVNAI